MTRILIVEDDAPIREALRVALTAAGFEVGEAATGERAVEDAEQGGARLMLLDLNLPDVDGFTVIRRIRMFSEIPIVVLSGRGAPRDKIAALDAGADDYVTKPFHTAELLARIRAGLRRGPDPALRDHVFVVDDLEIDMGRRRVRRGGAPVSLTPTELQLLEQLVSHPGALMTHETLLQRVWGPGYSTESHYLRVYIGQLRRKLGDEASKPHLIRTEPGIGYRWIAETAAPGG